MTVLSAYPWKTNAELIADVAKLGYLDGSVLDCSYGLGKFYSEFKPPNLTACDLNPEKSPIGYSVDFRFLPWGCTEFDCVVIDAPYRYNGRPDQGEFDARYGISEYTRWQDRLQLILDGVTECARVTRKYVCCKSMDQVVSGKKRWQTIDIANHAATVHLTLVDRFDMLTTPRLQPEGRRQVHSRGNYSTLLIFEKEK